MSLEVFLTQPGSIIVLGTIVAIVQVELFSLTPLSPLFLNIFCSVMPLLQATKEKIVKIKSYLSIQLDTQFQRTLPFKVLQGSPST